MENELENIQNDLQDSINKFKEDKKKQEYEKMQNRANLFAGFISSQADEEYKKIDKVVYNFSGNEIEDFIEVKLYHKDKLIAVANNFTGIVHLDGFPQSHADNVFKFAYDNAMQLNDVQLNTQFEVNFER